MSLLMLNVKYRKDANSGFYSLWFDSSGNRTIVYRFRNGRSIRIEISQVRCFRHVSKMSQEKLPKQDLLAKANGRRPVGRPRTR